MSEFLYHIWLGLFGPETPDKYFIREDVEDAPQSQFGAEQKQRSFDYDFVEIRFPYDPLHGLVGGYRDSDSYLETVVKNTTQLVITKEVSAALSKCFFCNRSN